MHGVEKNIDKRYYASIRKARGHISIGGIEIMARPPAFTFQQRWLQHLQERLRKQLMEIKEQRCLDLQLPCCTPAARKSGPDGSYSGSVATLQGMSLCGANASPSCHQGPPARWTDEELLARQAINGRFRRRRKPPPKTPMG
ncbi:hypothetical protein Nepgr_015899 [Nepenthes gracilis]|uniref:Uncharacterized protein n=1 Tax=Nepenthes gracilis TaxID=150966 RepID=A0AAD3SLT3_NEPGR|nr:hypothetical protein Nepgr_015899 [Nepenthes gracilis]